MQSLVAGKDESELEYIPIIICLNHLPICLNSLGLVTWDVALLPSTNVKDTINVVKANRFSIKVIEILGLFCDSVTRRRKSL